MNDAIGSKKNSVKDLLASSSKPGSISNIASSQAGSRANLQSRGSQANVAASKAGSQVNLASKPPSQAASRTASQADLAGAKAALQAGSKTASRIGSQANLSGSRVGSHVNLNSAKVALQSGGSRIGSQANLSASKAGSQINLTESKRPSVVDSPPKDVKATEEIELPPQQVFNYLQLGDTIPRAEAILPESAEFEFTKNYLKIDGVNGNVYDHLTRLVVNLMDTRPADALDEFENLSANVKRSLFKVEVPYETSSFKNVVADKKSFEFVQSQLKLMKPSETEIDPTTIGEYPDILDLAKLWEWAGVSFGQEETYLLLLSVKSLVQEKPLKSVRIWGKVFGTVQNYIIIEGELREGALDEDSLIANPVKEEEPVAPPAPVVEGEEGEVDSNAAKALAEEAALPKIKEKSINTLSKEIRIGVNKYVYYACNQVGGEWTRLPDVVPEQLQQSRGIRKAFSGDLNKQINSFPAFNGTEAQLLRCQIARITGATVISPAGYYTNDPDEENDDETEQSSAIIINNEYEGVTNENLASLTNWVHHVQYILPQGRTIWENPNPKKEEEEGEGEGEDEDDEKNSGDAEVEVEPESGPAILGPITADEEFGDTPSWSIRQCTSIAPTKFSPVCIKSNRWPGATLVSYNDKFTNIYMGDGCKAIAGQSQKFIVPKLGEVQREYGVDGGPGKAEDLIECLDPSVEEEAAFEEARKVKEEEAKEAEKIDADGEDGADGGEEGDGDGEENE